MNILKYIAIFSFAFVSSCADEPRFRFKDFCEEQGRKIGDQERYKDMLLEILEREKEFSKIYKGINGVHFFKWRRSVKEIHPQLDDTEIAYQYVTDFPGCCSVSPPAYFYPKYSSLFYEFEIDQMQANGRRWVADVYVDAREPTKKNFEYDVSTEGFNKIFRGFVKQSSACGDNDKDVSVA